VHQGSRLGGSASSEGGTVTYSFIGRPGIGSNVAAPSMASSSCLGPGGRRSTMASWCSPMNMLPFTKPAG
jgi:hypothetical protein